MCKFTHPLIYYLGFTREGEPNQFSLSTMLKSENKHTGRREGEMWPRGKIRLIFENHVHQVPPWF